MSAKFGNKPSKFLPNGNVARNPACPSNPIIPVDDGAISVEHDNSDVQRVKSKFGVKRRHVTRRRLVGC